MAKPGSDDARRVANGVPDLGRVGMSDERAWREQAKLEAALGLRCHGCGRRITLGFKFRSFDVTDPARPVVHRAACSREDCDFAERARDGATCVEQIEVAWLDSLGPDGPAFGIGISPAPAPTE